MKLDEIPMQQRKTQLCKQLLERYDRKIGINLDLIHPLTQQRLKLWDAEKGWTDRLFIIQSYSEGSPNHRTWNFAGPCSQPSGWGPTVRCSMGNTLLTLHKRWALNTARWPHCGHEPTVKWSALCKPSRRRLKPQSWITNHGRKLCDLLCNWRATPQMSTGVPPATALFNRPMMPQVTLIQSVHTHIRVSKGRLRSSYPNLTLTEPKTAKNLFIFFLTLSSTQTRCSLQMQWTNGRCQEEFLHFNIVMKICFEKKGFVFQLSFLIRRCFEKKSFCP